MPDDSPYCHNCANRLSVTPTCPHCAKPTAEYIRRWGTVAQRAALAKDEAQHK